VISQLFAFIAIVSVGGCPNGDLFLSNPCGLSKNPRGDLLSMYYLAKADVPINARAINVRIYCTSPDDQVSLPCHRFFKLVVRDARCGQRYGAVGPDDYIGHVDLCVGLSWVKIIRNFPIKILNRVPRAKTSSSSAAVILKVDNEAGSLVSLEIDSRRYSIARYSNDGPKLLNIAIFGDSRPFPFLENEPIRYPGGNEQQKGERGYGPGPSNHVAIKLAFGIGTLIAALIFAFSGIWHFVFSPNRRHAILIGFVAVIISALLLNSGLGAIFL
jgi:hypothetical protein